MRPIQPGDHCIVISGFHASPLGLCECCMGRVVRVTRFQVWCDGYPGWIVDVPEPCRSGAQPVGWFHVRTLAPLTPPEELSRYDAQHREPAPVHTSTSNTLTADAWEGSVKVHRNKTT